MAQDNEQLTDYIDLTADNITEAFSEELTDNQADKTESPVVATTKSNDEESTPLLDEQNENAEQTSFALAVQDTEEEEKYIDNEPKKDMAPKEETKSAEVDKEKKGDDKKEDDDNSKSEVIYRVYDKDQKGPKSIQ